MKADTSDQTLPAPGDRIRIVGGQFVGQRGTMVRRNGTNASVVLHAAGQTAVQTRDGRWWAVPSDQLLELTRVYPSAQYVIKDENE